MTRFHRPVTLQGAVNLLQRHALSEAIAGGQSLVPGLRDRAHDLKHLVAIDQIGDLRGITAGPHELIIGGAETHHHIASSQIVRDTLPALSDLARTIGDAQIRYRGTVAGALVSRPLGTDYLAALLALEATLHTTTGDHAIRYIDLKAGDRFLAPGELILSLSVRRPEAAIYQKHAHDAAGYATLGLFCARWTDQTHSLAVIGAGFAPSHMRLAAGQAVSDAGPDMTARSGLNPFAEAVLNRFLHQAQAALQPRKN